MPIRRFVIVLLVVACVGCGGGGDKSDDAGGGSGSSSSDSTTTAPGAATESGTPSSSTDAGGAPADQSSGQPANTQPSGGQPDATVPSGGGGGGGGGGGLGAPEPVLTGTYRYKQEGWINALGQTITSPPEGTLLVDPATPDGTQVSHRRTDPQQPPSDTVIRYGSDGMHLMSTTMRAQGIEVVCTFGSGIATPPWPPTVGAAISGSGNCGQSTATVSGSITGTESYALDGASVEVFVVKTTIVTSGQLVATINLTAWLAPSLRLVVHDETNLQGTFGGLTQFSGASTSDLLSATPT